MSVGILPGVCVVFFTTGAFVVGVVIFATLSSLVFGNSFTNLRIRELNCSF